MALQETGPADLPLIEAPPFVTPSALPSFVARRVERFYQERYREAWGGVSIMKGRAPSASDVVLQSNDYLAIAGHPQLTHAIESMARQSAEAPLMSAVFLQDGSPLHSLERELAGFLGYSECVLTQSGFAANQGLIQSLLDPGVPVYIDTLAHASLWEGVLSARAQPVRVPHNDVIALRSLVAEHGAGVVLIDSVYSTNGSVADLEGFAAASAEGGCLLVVDESHSLGTHGAHGEGLVASLGLQDRVHFVTASLAKAYACRAGLIACPAALGLFITMTSRPAIFSSSLMPIDAAAIAAAHRIVRTEDWRRERLWRINRHLRAELEAMGYPVGMGSEQIVAFEIGTERAVMRARDVLESEGIFGSIFCPPATGKERCLIRFSLNAGLSDDQVEHFLEVCTRRRADLAPDGWSAHRYLRGAPGH